MAKVPRRIFDKLLELHANVAGGGATETATWTSTAFPLRIRDLKTGTVIVINLHAVDQTTGNETCVFSLQVCDTIGGSYVTVLTIPGMIAAGRVEIPINPVLCEYFKANAEYLQLVATLGGTTPIVDFEAFVAVGY